MKESKKLGILGVVGIMLASSLTIMVGSAITPAIPEIGRQFGMGDMASWLVTVPALGVVVGAVPCGRYLGRHGAYATCLLGLALYGALGIAGAFMPGKVSEIVVRFLLGIATALVMTSSTALISDFFQGQRQLRMIAIQGMAIELGGVVFLSVSGQLALRSWQLPYFIYGIAFVALAMLVAFVPSVAPQADVDLHAVQGSQDPEGEGDVGVRPVLALSFVGMMVFFTAVVSLPSYLQGTKGLSTAFTGNYLACVSLIAVVFAGLMPRFVTKVSPKGCLSVAYGCYAVAHLLLFLSANDVLLYVAALFMGMGFGLSTPLVNNLTVERSSATTKSRNLSLYSMATFLGQFLSSLLASTVQGSFVFLGASCIAVVTCLAVVVFFRNSADEGAGQQSAHGLVG